MNDNPLLDFSGLPRFASIRAEHATPAVDHLLAQARASIERVVADPREPTWSTVAEPIADALDHLHRAWGALRHMNAVVSTPALRDAYNGNLPRITSFYTEIGQDERLYAKYRALAASSAFAALDDAKRRVIENELRDFRLTGAELPTAEKARFKAIRRSWRRSSATFDDHVLDATNDVRALRRRRVAGSPAFPADVVAEARAGAKADGREGWKLTVRMPCFLPVMKYARRPLAPRRAASCAGRRAPPTSAREAGMGQRPADRARARAPARGRAAARLSALRRACRSCRRWRSTPTRCSRSCATSRRRAKPYAEARHRRARGVRPRRARASRRSSPGTSRTRARSS